MQLTDLEQVQQRVGKLPAPRDLKMIDYIDKHAKHWLSYSHFAFLAFGQDSDIKLSAAGGDPGLASVIDEKHLNIPLDALDDSTIVKTGLAFGALFLVSGMDETLRLNGKVSKIENGSLTLQIEECYLHCAKAFRRSDFWQAPSIEQAPEQAQAWVEQSTFIALATINNSGQADVSPKGDPAGLLLQYHGDAICFPDRPGNRRVDSFRNILEQAEVSLIALVPGCNEILKLQGTAAISSDEALLEGFAVKGKTPKLVTQITPSSIEITSSGAITKADLWQTKPKPADLKPADIFKAHVKHSKENSLTAKIARTALSVPGAMEKGLEADYKNNLY